MMRSMYSGVAGLKTHQTKMDVIGNNIANVNTVAYKSQSVTFSELMYQTTQAASGANAATGTAGINARQIGLGSKTGAINTAISSQGASQTTNNPFDIRITGSAFFVVSNGQDNFFTRDGSFYVDGLGNLAMTSNGYNVMGWQVDPSTNDIKQDTVSALRIMSAENMTYDPESTTKAMVTGILDKNDTNLTSSSGKAMNLMFYDKLGYSYTAKFTIKETGTDGTYDLAIEKITDANNVEVTGGPTALASGIQLTFDPSTGKFTGVGGSGVTSVNLSLAAIDSRFTDIEVNFQGTTMFNNSGTSTIAAASGDENKLGAGRKLGQMSGVSIQNDGRIYASYDNGMSRLLGQIAVAEFANASGLQKEGDNLYSASQNSGDFDGIGIEVTSGGGYMTTGVLEMSNVDLSAEFTEMITTQRGFQANSRIITVSDTLLEELVNLKR